MIRKALRQLLGELAEVRGLLDAVERRLDRIEVVTMVREPAANTAADAYEGLRRQVVASASARMAHLAQVAEFDLALARGADRTVLDTLVEGWFAQAGVVRIADPAHPDAELLFELVDDRGGALVVLEPAYRDSVTARIVRQGRALREEPRRVSVTAPAKGARSGGAAGPAGMSGLTGLTGLTEAASPSPSPSPSQEAASLDAVVPSADETGASGTSGTSDASGPSGAVDPARDTAPAARSAPSPTSPTSPTSEDGTRR